MSIKLDQKWIATIGVGLGGALAALAGSDTVSPQIAAYAGAGLLILGMLGLYHAPSQKQREQAVADHLASQQESPHLP